MSKVKFEAVKELVDQKKYAEARMILRTIDAPMARRWEAKIETLDPRPSEAPVSSQPKITYKSVEFDTESGKLAKLDKNIVYVIVMIVILLLASMLGVFLPKTQSTSQSRKTVTAFYSSFNATLTKVYVAKLPTSTATATTEPTQVSIINQTHEAFGRNQLATRVMYQATRDAELAAAAAKNRERTALAVAAFPTSTPQPTEPTPVFTAMPSAHYFALKETYLSPCPNTHCVSSYRSIEIKGSTIVTVVGIVEGEADRRYGNQYYKIEYVEKNGGLSYRYQHIELFAPMPS